MTLIIIRSSPKIRTLVNNIRIQSSVKTSNRQSVKTGFIGETEIISLFIFPTCLGF